MATLLRGKWGSTAAVAGLVAACVVALLGPSLSGDKEFTANDMLYFTAPWEAERPAELTRPSNPLLGDPVYVFNPDLEIAREEIRSGRLPAWNPYAHAGRPLLASQQVAPFAPTNLPVHVLPFDWAIGLAAALKLVLAAFGMYLLARALALPRAGAAVAAVAFAFGAYLWVWLQHPHTNIYALLPWIVWLIERIVRERRAADVAGLGLVTGAALVGGHPQSAAIVLAGAAAWAVARLVMLGRTAGTRAATRVGGLLGLGAGLGLLIGAVMLVPFIEILGEGTEAERGVDAPQRRGLLSLAFPELWGRPDKIDVDPAGPLNFVERTIYIGALPLMLAAVALALPRRRTLLLLAGAVAATWLAVYMPATNWIRDLPLLEAMNLDRLLILLVFALALLAGVGMEIVCSERARLHRKRLLAVGVAVLALPIVGAAIVLGLPDQWGDALGQLPALDDDLADLDSVRAAAILRWALAAGLALGLVALLLHVPRRRVAAVTVAALAFAAADVVSIDSGFHPQTEPEIADATPGVVNELQQIISSNERMVATDTTFGPNQAARFGLRDARGHDLPALARYTLLWRALGGLGLQRTSYLPPAGHDRLADVFSAGWVLDGQRLRRNRTALPRAWVAYGARGAPGRDEALGAVSVLPTRQLESAPVIEGAESREPARPPSPARVHDVDSQHVSVELEAREPGWLVLHDSFYPGWDATVDGDEVPISAANGAFRAVPVPAGAHTVEFKYAPSSIRIGLVLSLLGLVTAAALLLAGPLRRRVSGSRA
ncbi:MAG TPA: YfhO family protein [Thermoleophilaceae bacterium]|nr:YfhO family protein [Thermoleophilaceae bacterium]